MIKLFPYSSLRVITLLLILFSILGNTNCVLSADAINTACPATIQKKDSIARELLNFNSAEGLQLGLENYEFIKGKGFSKRCEGNILLTLGLAYNDNNNIVRCAKILLEAIKIFQEENMYECIIESYNAIGGAFYNIGEFEQAVKYTQSAIDVAQENDSHKLTPILFNNLSGAEGKLKNTKAALNYANKAIELSIKANDYSSLLHAYSTKGEILLDQENYDSSLYYYQKAYQSGIEHNVQTEYSETFCNYGFALNHLYLGDTLKAIKHADRTLILAEEGNHMMFERDAADILSKIWLNKSMMDSAYHYLAKMITVEKSINKQERLRQLNQLAVQENEVVIAAQIEEVEHQRMLTIVIAIIGILLIVIIIVYVISNKKINRLYNQLKSQKMTIELKNTQLSEQRDQLDNLNKLKDRMFSAVMHDFKTPINTMESMLNLLLKKQLTPDEAVYISKEIHKKLMQSKLSINNVIIWVKSQLKGFESNIDEININLFLEEVLDYHSNAAKEKGIALNYSVDEEVSFMSDREMLFIIINNLITNAIKFTKTKGVVDIRAQLVNEKIIFEVIDNGMGLSSDLQETLFDTSKSMQGTNREKGTGLGLIICKDLTEKLNGTISVSSEEGKGSTFKVSVPSIKKTTTYLP